MKNLSKKLLLAVLVLFVTGFLILFFYFFSRLPESSKEDSPIKPLLLPQAEENIQSETEKKNFILYEITKTGSFPSFFDLPEALSHLNKTEGEAHSLSMIQALIQEGAEVNTKDSTFGWSPLHWAVSHGKEKAVSLLLGEGADVNAKDENFWTPLHEAVSNNDLKMAFLLLEKGAGVNVEDKNLWTPLHEAVLNNDLKIASLLLERGADVNKKDKDYWSPLELAEKEQNKAAVALLSEYNFSFKLKVLALAFLSIITSGLGFMTLRASRDSANAA